jgi:hypothetical protein
LRFTAALKQRRDAKTAMLGLEHEERQKREAEPHAEQHERVEAHVDVIIAILLEQGVARGLRYAARTFDGRLLAAARRRVVALQVDCGRWDSSERATQSLLLSSHFHRASKFAVSALRAVAVKTYCIGET